MIQPFQPHGEIRQRLGKKDVERVNSLWDDKLQSFPDIAILPDVLGEFINRESSTFAEDVRHLVRAKLSNLASKL
jgi:hypothetical protein